MELTEHYRRLEAMYQAAPIQQFFSSILRVEEATATITLPVLEGFHHAFGSAHGAVYFKLLDDAAYFAANSVVPDRAIVTASFSVQLLRSVSAGSLTAEGHLINNAGRLFVAESQIVDDAGNLIAIGHGTFSRTGLALKDIPAYRDGGEK